MFIGTWTRDLIHLTCVTSSTSTTLVHPTKQINSVERFNESCTHSRVAFGHGRLFWLVFGPPHFHTNITFQIKKKGNKWNKKVK